MYNHLENHLPIRFYRISPTHAQFTKLYISYPHNRPTVKTSLTTLISLHKTLYERKPLANAFLTILHQRMRTLPNLKFHAQTGLKP